MSRTTEGAALLLGRINAGIARVVQAPEEFGGPAVKEAFMLVMVDCRQTLLRPAAQKADPHETRRAYARFVAMNNGGESTAFLHQAMADKGRLAELPALLGAYAAWIAVEYPPEPVAPPMTSAQLAAVHEQAHLRWFHTALRKRLPDTERFHWHDRYCARAVTLISRWRS